MTFGTYKFCALIMTLRKRFPPLYTRIFMSLNIFGKRTHEMTVWKIIIRYRRVYCCAANSISTSCVVHCTNHYHMHSLSASGTRPNSSQKRTWHRIFSIITKPINSLYRHIITLCRAEITLYYANQHFCSSSELKYFENGGFS